MNRRYDRETPAVAESKYEEDEYTYLVRKVRRLMKVEAKGQSVREMFEEMDRNGDGTLTPMEFRRGLRNLGFKLAEVELTELIRHLDMNGNGEISYRELDDFIHSNEFQQGDVEEILDRLRVIIDKSSKGSYNAMQDVFEEFDQDFSGSIDEDEFHEGLSRFGMKLTVAEASLVMNRFPCVIRRREKKKLRYRDFVAAMRGQEPRHFSYKDAHGERPANFAIRKLAQEVERCARTRNGDLDIRRVFEDMDRDGSGSLDRQEIRTTLESLGIKLSKSELIDLMDFFDPGPNGEITVESFVQFALKQDPATKRLLDRVRLEIERISKRLRGPPDYRSAFRELDQDGSGTIDAHEMKQAMRNLGLRLSSSEIRQIMNMFDSDGDQRISSREFVDFLQATAPPKEY